MQILYITYMDCCHTGSVAPPVAAANVSVTELGFDVYEGKDYIPTGANDPLVKVRDDKIP